MKYIKFFLFIHLSTIFGQLKDRPDMKWGKISMHELTMTSCNFDSNAMALILFDYGESTPQGFFKHTRIKVFKKGASNIANYRIPYFVSGSKDITQFEGTSYNLQKNGTIQKTNLDRNTIFYTEFRDNIQLASFSMPNVIEGTVFEFKYKLGFVNAFDWQFQDLYPIQWSEYKTVIPSSIQFQDFLFGNLKVDYISKDYDVNEQAPTKTWVMKQVPALKPEPYMDSYQNYLSKLEFQIFAVEGYQSINSNNPTVKYVRLTYNTWNKVSEFLLDDPYFGKLFGNKVAGKFADADSVDNIISIKDPKNRMIACFKFVQKNIKWNGNYYASTSGSIGKTISKRTGISGDVNMILFNLLIQANIRVEPVIIRTKNIGRLETTYPMTDRFNHFIVKSSIGDESWFLDATDQNLPFDFVPLNSLNSAGLTVEKEPKFIAVNQKNISKRNIVTQFLVDKSGTLTGLYQEKSDGYFASDIRENYKSIDKNKFTENHLQGIINNIEEVSISNIENILLNDKPIKMTFKISSDAPISVNNSQILLPLLIKPDFKNQPFMDDFRKYDIAMPFVQESTLMNSYTIPEGYEITYLPTSTKITFGLNDEIVWTLRTTVEDKTIKILSKMNLNKSEFSKDQYNEFKSFFSDLVLKQNEKIIISKK
ncbi:MAG: hypothetical protein SFY32_07465 [Bacteroidota bacterium]|nr:hypothetical protein [Bacteroidota bacterium]